MHETLQRRDRSLVPRFEERRGPRSQRREDARDRSLNGRDAAEGERGGDEGHDLAIRGVGVAVREDERVRVEPARAPLPPQSLEAVAEEDEVRGAGRASHAAYASIPAVSPRRPGKEAPPPPEEKPDSRRTILVGVFGREIPRATAEDQLDELERLVDTAGGVVVARTLQERRGPDPATYVGSGKVEEIAEAARALGAGWTVFDDELTPTQARNLDKKLPTQVLDRAGVILDIFASRARSREAMTQVELARLQYELPRPRRAVARASLSSAAEARSGAARASGRSSWTAGGCARASRSSRKSSRTSRPSAT